MFSKKVILALFAFTHLTIAGTTQAATILSGDMTVDNQFSAYISTDDSVAGTQIASGLDWTTVDSFSGVSLAAGQNYFLHVSATDVGGIGSFIGDFTLNGADHVFANGLTYITTNTIDWQASSTGWGNYTTPYSYGTNGVSPWGTLNGIDLAAEQIWATDYYAGNDADNQNYFTLAIVATAPSAVPVPAAFWLFGSGLIGLVSIARRK